MNWKTAIPIVALTLSACQNNQKNPEKGASDTIRQELLDSIQTPPSSHIETIKKETQEKVYLTIDDGPSLYTKDILKALDSLGHKATFFRVGQNITPKYQNTLQQLINDGHDIGSHSYSHAQFGKLSLEEAKNQVQKTEDKIENLIGEKPKFFRYPYGQEIQPSLRSEFNHYLEEKGYGKHTFWTIDTRDRDSKTTHQDLKNTLSQIKAGDIILIHEKSRTVPETLILLDSILDSKNLISAPLSQKE